MYSKQLLCERGTPQCLPFPETPLPQFSGFVRCPVFEFFSSQTLAKNEG